MSVQAAAIYRVDCGGAVPYVDSRGNTWQRDRFYVPGKTLWGRVGGERANRVEQAQPGEKIEIHNAEVDEICRSETYGNHSYFFKLTPGPYKVRLHFTETYKGCTGPGFRVFSVLANGEPVLPDLDVYAEAGGLFREVVKEFDIRTEGDLRLEFRSGTNPAIISGIEIFGPEQPASHQQDEVRPVVLANDILQVEVDQDCPVIYGYKHKQTGLSISGNLLGDDEDVLVTHSIFSADVLCDGKPLEASIRRISSGGDEQGRWYRYAGFTDDEKAFDFTVQLSLDDTALIYRVGQVSEYGGCRVQRIRFNRFRPLCLAGESSDCVLGIDNDLKHISDTPPLLWKNVPYALVSKAGISAAVYCNQVDPGGPLEVSTFNTTDGKRAAGIGPHTFYHRTKDTILLDFEMRVGVVADYNRDGLADWVDAANWLGDQIPSSIPDLYARSHINKYFLCVNDKISFSIDQCRERMEQLYHLTQGSPHIVYLVGWQYHGHDSEYPAMDIVNEGIGGREKLLALMNDGMKYNFNFSFHFNLDDAYPTSPDWDRGTISVGGDGELVKGGVWAGNQAYIISPYKLVKSGKAKRMVDHMLDLYPLCGTIHLDVLSAVPYRSSHDPGDPSDDLDNLVLGKLRIVEIFRERGIDVTSEWATYPFVGPMTYFWHAGMIRPGRYPITAAILHGKALYGGWQPDILGGDESFIPEYLVYGAMADNDYHYSTPLTRVLDIEFLLDGVGMLLNRKPMTGFIRRGNVVRVDYGQESWVQWNQRTNDYEVWVDGMLVSKDFACMIPASGGGYLVYSRDAKETRFKLGKVAGHADIRVYLLDAKGSKTEVTFELSDDELILDARAHTPYLVTTGAD